VSSFLVGVSSGWFGTGATTSTWVGFPRGKIPMGPLFHGANVDGGTFPADIWGAYMKQAVGKYCGEFAKPKQPFVSQPFMGHYATTGRKGADDGQDATGTPAPPDAQGGDEQKNGTGDPGKKADPGGQQAPGSNGATTYDPGKYESPPQGAPDTGDPGTGNPPGQ